MTAQDLANKLGYKLQTLRKWRLMGQGPVFVRLGDGPKARVAYWESDVLEWIRQRTFAHTTEETAGTGSS